MSLTCEVKLRTLAQANSTLNALFFSPTPRWFGPQLQPQYIQHGSCVTVWRLATEFLDVMEGGTSMYRPRFQLDVWDLDADTARLGMKAVREWLDTIDLVSDSQFDSPPTTPNQFPTTIVDERQRAIAATEGMTYVEMLDFRIYCTE